MNRYFKKQANVFTAIMIIMQIMVQTSCSQDDGQPQNDAIMLASQMDVPQTRATADNTWTGNEHVQVVINTDAARTFTAAADGTLTPQTTLYWQNFGSGISACAWYPNSYSFPTDQSSTGKLQSADFIFAPTVTGITKDNFNSSTKKLQFYHKTAKVVATIVKGNGVSDADVNGATVRFLGYTTTTTNTTDGKIAGSGSGEISPLKDGNKYTALLIPQNMTDKQFIKVTIGSTDYYYKPASGQANLEAGKVYTYTITVNRTGITVTVDSSGITWTGGTQYDNTAS